MRTSHLILAGVAAATFGVIGAAPGAAETPQTKAPGTMPPATAPAQPSASMSAEQKAQMESWPAEQQAAYRAWPPETQSYYWTLTAERQGWFWRLQDQAKIAITAMTGPEREAAWQQIEQAVAERAR